MKTKRIVIYGLALLLVVFFVLTQQLLAGKLFPYSPWHVGFERIEGSRASSSRAAGSCSSRYNDGK